MKTAVHLGLLLLLLLGGSQASILGSLKQAHAQENWQRVVKLMYSENCFTNLAIISIADGKTLAKTMKDDVPAAEAATILEAFKKEVSLIRFNLYRFTPETYDLEFDDIIYASGGDSGYKLVLGKTKSAIIVGMYNSRHDEYAVQSTIGFYTWDVTERGF